MSGVSGGLGFSVLDARAERHAAAPTVVLRLEVTAPAAEPVHAIALTCQVRIEPQRRSYTEDEEVALRGVFGETSQWSRSLRPFLWASVPAMVPGFTGRTELDLAIPCTYDMDVAGTGYLLGLRGGDIPIVVLFSGTVFGPGPAAAPGGFSVRPVPWSDEASYRLPQQVWRDAMDQHFPGSAWLRLDRQAFDELCRYRAARGLPTWERTVEALLGEVSAR